VYKAFFAYPVDWDQQQKIRHLHAKSVLLR